MTNKTRIYAVAAGTTILVALIPVQALARGQRYRLPKPGAIHAKGRTKFLSDTRCKDPKTHQWYPGCK